MGFVDELKWRGLLQDIMPGTEELLNKGMVKGYIGFDPTADSLGVGNLVQIMNLLHFQNAGHKPIALIGGATGMVGDPTGKNAERNLLDEKTLNHNIACQKKQLEKFLNFGSGENSAELVNNYDWFKNFTFLDFIRDVGKHITINYMMSKDSVKNRMENETGMSFTEFTYQLVQGYDFYYLWKNNGVMFQMGGSDQWGNIVTGTELIRRKDGGEAFALTTHLIKKADGTKFGKTESGNIWLDPARTSPYKFYQFWLNASDEDAKNFIRIFTLKTKEDIESIEAAHTAEPHLRRLQKALADDITTRVHSADDLKKAIAASEILFGNSTAEALQTLSEQDILDVFEGVPTFKIGTDILSQEADVLTLLSETAKVFPSKGEARRSLQENAVSINKAKVTLESKVTSAELLKGKYLIAQRGKKNYYLLVAE
ncbi:MAG: tyrosine--tRNA ligase [Bacteroidetes bacterium]|nr:tyrosine--tRNA ligase [Bacteroidota bacterium]